MPLIGYDKIRISQVIKSIKKNEPLGNSPKFYIFSEMEKTQPSLKKREFK